MVAAADPRVLNYRQDNAFELSVVHEFTHAYINPFVDSYFVQMESSLRNVFAVKKEEMCAMGYGSSKIMITETFVRAIVSLYAMEKYGDRVAKSVLRDAQERGFLLIVAMFDSLKKARADGGKLWTFHQSQTEYISEVNRVALTLEIGAPYVDDAYPQNGAVNVDPALTVVTFTFDQPMRKSWSLCRSPNETLLFPELNGTPSFDAAHKKISIPVILKPGKNYFIFLNTNQFKGFMSEHNIALPSYSYTFSTRK